MSEEKNNQEGGCCSTSCCSTKGKFFAGLAIGLLVAGAGFGLFMMGKCSASKACPMSAKACPMSAAQPATAENPS